MMLRQQILFMILRYYFSNNAIKEQRRKTQIGKTYLNDLISEKNKDFANTVFPKICFLFISNSMHLR
jgi:hypothetical protein